MKMIPRRTFLAGAAGAPLILASAAHAGANDRIRTAIIGMGGRGRDHMEFLAGIEGVEVATFCDPDEHRMQENASAFESRTGKRPRLEPDLRKVLEDKNIDVITIAAPNYWLGSLLLKKGQSQDALPLLQQSDKLRSGMLDVLLDLGKAYLLQNRVEEAEKAFQRIVAINDSDELAGAAHFQLSQIYRKLGRSAEADQQIARFRELTKSPK